MRTQGADIFVIRLQKYFQRKFRPARIAALRAEFPELTNPDACILDVGGRAGWWQMVSPDAKDITIVNIDDNYRREVEQAGYTFVQADGCDLPFADGEFDLAMSNSVIEHVGTLDNQRRFASEILRVGRNVYVQTPNKWFPIEPHYVCFGLHWLPREALPHVLRHFSLWGWSSKPTPERVRRAVDEIRLMTLKEIQEFMPGCTVRREKFLGLTKSFMLSRREVADQAQEVEPRHARAG